MAAPKQTKKQRIEEAREAARAAREKREKRQRMLRVLIPTLVSIGVLAIVAVVVVVVAIQPRPAAALPGGPKNMQSDGIVFEQQDGKAHYVSTPALQKGETPKATDWSADQGVPHIVTYIDLSCPVCKEFEATYGASLKKMVAEGKATLEIHPIAILDQNYTTNYSSRSANVAACIANYDPSGFLDALPALYEKQAEEKSAGLTNDQMISIIHAAGVDNAQVDSCIRGDSFKAWVKAATARTVSIASLQGSQGFGTPTVTVDGHKWDNQSDFTTFITSNGKTGAAS